MKDTMKESDKTDRIMKDLVDWKKALNLNNWEPTPLKPADDKTHDKTHDKFHDKFMKEYNKLMKEPKYWSLNTVLRNILSLGIIYMVYTETGPWTALLAFLVFLQVEMSSYHLRLVCVLLKDIIANFKDVVRVKQESRQRILEQLDEIENRNKEIINNKERMEL